MWHVIENDIRPRSIAQFDWHIFAYAYKLMFSHTSNREWFVVHDKDLP